MSSKDIVNKVNKPERKAHKLKNNKSFIVMLALMLAVSMIPAGAFALNENAGMTGYSGNDTALQVPVSNDSVQQLPATGSLISEAKGTNTEYHSQGDIVRFMSVYPTDYSRSTKFKLDPDMGSEYQKSLNMLKTIRYIAGIPYDLALSDKYAAFAQEAADACLENGEISHYLGHHTDECNLAWVSYPECSFRWSILDGYMEDGGENNRGILGHRRWILNPLMASTGFGYASSSTKGTFMTMYTDDMAAASAYYGVMWPARNMPLSYFTDKSPWSYSYGDKINLEKCDIMVEMTDNRNPNAKLQFSNALQDDGYFAVNNGYFGQPGCIIWEPSKIDGYEDGDSYHVTISNTINSYVLADYDVNFFDSDDYLAPADFQFVAIALDSEEGCPALCWTRSEDADFYEIYRKSYGSDNWKCIESEFRPLTSYSSTIEYLDPNVSKGIKYVYKLNAVKVVNGKRYTTPADSAEMHTGSELERSVATKLGKATISSAKAYGKKKNQIKWKSVSKASGYKIYRRLYGKSSWTLVKTVTKSSTLSWKDTTAKSGKKYQYRIRAYRKNFGNYVYGAYSSVKTVKTK